MDREPSQLPGPRIETLLVGCVASTGVNGAGMSLTSRAGSPEAVYGSDDVAGAVERLQVTLGEGPCIDSVTSGLPVLVDDLEGVRSAVADRWPVFALEARRLGVRALFAFPLRIGAISLGAVDLHRLAPGPLAADELSSALSVMDAVAESLLDVRTGYSGHDGGPTLSTPAIHQAAGRIMVQLGCSIEDALVRLRAAAFAEGVPIHALADAVVAGERRFQEDDR